MHIAIKADDIDHYDIFCEVCNNRLFRTREGLNGVTEEGYIDGRKWIFKRKKEEKENDKDV